MGIIYTKYQTVPYRVYGVHLYAVERDDGYIVKYCNSKLEADELVKQYNNQ